MLAGIRLYIVHKEFSIARICFAWDQDVISLRVGGVPCLTRSHDFFTYLGMIGSLSIILRDAVFRLKLKCKYTGR